MKKGQEESGENGEGGPVLHLCPQFLKETPGTSHPRAQRRVSQVPYMTEKENKIWGEFSASAVWRQGGMEIRPVRANADRGPLQVKSHEESKGVSTMNGPDVSCMPPIERPTSRPAPSLPNRLVPRSGKVNEEARRPRRVLTRPLHVHDLVRDCELQDDVLGDSNFAASHIFILEQRPSTLAGNFQNLPDLVPSACGASLTLQGLRGSEPPDRHILHFSGQHMAAAIPSSRPFAPSGDRDHPGLDQSLVEKRRARGGQTVLLRASPVVVEILVSEEVKMVHVREKGFCLARRTFPGKGRFAERAAQAVRTVVWGCEVAGQLRREMGGNILDHFAAAPLQIWNASIEGFRVDPPKQLSPIPEPLAGAWDVATCPGITTHASSCLLSLEESLDFPDF
ncbi:hypothetical protein BDK51DRAFT_41247 [Blyttiomyces helicus]|uniref:Uncharacterized protein n=1 Tax=Blyttiomyces helicus TaxID=388810 RepID=A0A4P9WKE5_9FUNG|nr:hypothetical protein BDK51DRAFT_41247 [Blyttiomyces helicus]|eukprot:RKO92585.1 hypothetical protein BDK51DRAFT_41247 [Blyttiomyces helicus]